MFKSMFKSPFDYPGTALIAFSIATISGLCLFLYTLGIDVSYPKSVYVGILPIFWHFAPANEAPVDFWYMVGSGAMTCLCILGRLFLAFVIAVVVGCALFRWFVFFVDIEYGKPGSSKIQDKPVESGS